jgi:MarR family transcriptional regulator, 2-MHQ and catechol-resistance regulon repressor
VSNLTAVTAPRLWLVLARSYRALNLVVDQSMVASGICLSDFMVLEALLHKGPLTISEIQSKVLLASGSMTAAVDRLEDKRLLVRRAMREDRRARLLDLTPEGRQLIKSAYQKHAKDLEAAMSVLSDDDKQQLYKRLKNLGLFASEMLKSRHMATNNRRETTE